MLRIPWNALKADAKRLLLEHLTPIKNLISFNQLSLAAGWSSPVARQAHNLKVVGSNPTPATNNINDLAALRGGFFLSGCKLVAKIVITAGMPYFLTVVF